MKRILVVDDEPLVLRAIQRILTAEYEVTSVEGGEQAVAVAGRWDFDLALVDQDMPKPDGLRTLARLRDLRPGSARLLMTSLPEGPPVVEAVQRGEVTGVLAKPFQPSELKQRVREAFEASARLDAWRRRGVQAVLNQERAMLREWLERRRFAVALQPIVHAHTGQLVAHEALLRPQHPTLCTPPRMLAVAERTGLLQELGAAVAHHLAAWLAATRATGLLFLNLHPAQLADVDRLMAGLSPLAPHARKVVLEVTERIRLRSVPDWSHTVEVLQGSGYAIAVDDLGAGYAALSVLADLNPAFIKVDMSIVRDVDQTPRKQRLIQLLSRFAEATDARLVAEGVETAGEARALRECGAHLLQGYHLGRPRVWEG